MKTKLILAFSIAAGALFFIACNKQNMPEALSIQQPKKYSEEYYANLRAYKKTKHQVFYGWFAAYGNKEGVVAEYKKSASWGEHIAGLPDSLDFCSLWAGIPSLKENDSLSTYNPIAYTELRHAMDVKGIKFVIPEIVRIQKYPNFEMSDKGIKDYANYMLKMVFDYDLDGLDLDYEPNNGQFVDWIAGNNFAKLVQILGDSIGPKSTHPDKYLIVDYYTDAVPPAIEPYINYLVNQSYTQGTTSTSATFLQNRYNSISWCPPGKFIVTENFGDWWATGGSPFTDANNNTISPIDGNRMYSMEGFARWNPKQGKKAGWGAFYFDRDYNNTPAYKYVRRSIQIVNPAVY